MAMKSMMNDGGRKRGREVEGNVVEASQSSPCGMDVRLDDEVLLA